RRERYADLVLAEMVRTDVDRALAGELLASSVTADHAILQRLAADHASLLARLRFLASAMPEQGLPSDPLALFADAVHACAAGRRSVAELRQADLGAALRGLLTGAQRAALARDAPARFQLPTGREVTITYERDRPPWVSARIQELFGLLETPRVAGGRVPVVVQLLPPNTRPAPGADAPRHLAP